MKNKIQAVNNDITLEGPYSEILNVENVINKIHHSDCLEFLRRLPDNCIDLTVTSPPYRTQRDYKGFTFNFEEIANELFRVTKAGGLVIWVVGDSVVNGIQALEPQRQVIYFDEIGLGLHQRIIYMKTSSSYGDKTRYSNVTEDIYVLTKNKPKSVHLIQDKINIHAGAKIHGTDRLKNGELRSRITDRTVKEVGTRENIFRYNTGKYNTSEDPMAHEHPAPYPDLLAFDMIRSYSNEQDIVLDPMSGSGTTCVMAKALNRKFIGIDISEEYCNLAKKRLVRKWNVEELIRKSKKQYNSRVHKAAKDVSGRKIKSPVTIPCITNKAA